MPGLRIKMQIGKQSVVKPLFLMTACCHRNTLLSFVVFVVGSLVKQCLRKNGMTEIQLTKPQFAQLQIDNLTSKDIPYFENWDAQEVELFNAIVNAVDYDNEFTYNMRGWSRQRVVNGTGGMIEVNEMNADELYHLFSCYLSKLPSGVVESLGEVS